MTDVTAHNRAEIPRLRIHHLMACVVVTAIQLSLHRAFYPNSLSSTSVDAAILKALSSTFSAIALTLGMFSIYWYLKGIASFAEPGQYLLLGRAIFAIGFYLTIAAMVFGNGGGFATNPFPLGSTMMSIAWKIQYVVSSLFFAWCAWRIADSRAWRAVFVVRAIAPLISSSFMISWILYNLGQSRNAKLAALGPTLGGAIVELAFEVAAAADDLRHARSRSWTTGPV